MPCGCLVRDMHSRGVKSLRAELAQANAEVAKPTIVLYDEDPR